MEESEVRNAIQIFVLGDYGRLPLVVIAIYLISCIVARHNKLSGTCSIKHYALVMYRLRSKLVFLPKTGNNNKNKSLLHNMSNSVHYKSKMFYSTDPWCQYYKAPD